MLFNYGVFVNYCDIIGKFFIMLVVVNGYVVVVGELFLDYN